MLLRSGVSPSGSRQKMDSCLARTKDSGCQSARKQRVVLVLLRVLLLGFFRRSRSHSLTSRSRTLNCKPCCRPEKDARYLRFFDRSRHGAVCL